MDLHFDARGQGQPLIILHGLFGSLQNWASITSRLAKDFKVFAVDQRNHGSSPHSFEMDYKLMAQDVLSLMQNQGFEDAFIMGHSMGGKTAMQLALLHPSAVKGLIVVDIAPRAYPPRHLKAILGMRALDLSRFETRSQMDAALAAAIPDPGTRGFLLKNVARTASGQFEWRIGLEEIQRNYSKLTEALGPAPPFTRPTLFIRGETSDFLLETDLEFVKPLFPLARSETIPGAGHLVHVENPDRFLEIVLGFLKP